jgi:hypothetical protein
MLNLILKTLNLYLVSVMGQKTLTLPNQDSLEVSNTGGGIGS